MQNSTEQTKFHVKIKSTVHPSIEHTIEIDLRCHEKMPKEKTMKKIIYIRLKKNGKTKN